MSSPESQRSILDEIDDRQEALLHDLACLNARVETLLNDCLAAREQQRSAEEEGSELSSRKAPLRVVDAAVRHC